MVAYARYVPRDSFIGEYMHMCSSLETSLSYDFWGAIWALGSCLGRSVVVPRPHAPVNMNWYVMLAAESGVTRKSTAVRIARNIVHEAMGGDYVIEGRETPEHLLEVLIKQPHIAIAVNELVTFLGRESYVIELPALLTDLYDCPQEKRGGTITRGVQIVREPFLTFMSASTPSWLLGAVNPSVIEGGFTSRCMFVYDEKPKQKVPWPKDTLSDRAVQEHLTRAVARAREVGRIDLLPAAMRRYERWYKSRDTVTDMPFLASFLAREDAHVLRMAACLCINNDVLAIDRVHIDGAIKIVNEAKAGALQIFSGKGTIIKTAQGVEKITRMLIESGGVGIAHTPLYASVRHYMSADDFKIAVQLMHELGMLNAAIERRSGGGRKGRRYFRTEKTTHGPSMNALRDALA